MQAKEAIILILHQALHSSQDAPCGRRKTKFDETKQFLRYI